MTSALADDALAKRASKMLKKSTCRRVIAVVSAGDGKGAAMPFQYPVHRDILPAFWRGHFLAGPATVLRHIFRQNPRPEHERADGLFEGTLAAQTIPNAVIRTKIPGGAGAPSGI
jgi:hypothetical protein